MCLHEQVLDWTQTMLTVGEAFSGCESSTLRDAIARQSGRFFQAFHAANLQVLASTCIYIIMCSLADWRANCSWPAD